MFFKIWLLIQEFFHDLRTQKTRAFLTTFAVSWGTFSVILLLAFGEGLSLKMQEGLLNNGDQIMRIYGGNTSKEYQGLPKGRRVRVNIEDADLLLRSIPEIELTSPAFGERHSAEYKDNITTSGYTVGANPSFETMRRMYSVAGGRFLNDEDMRLQRRVAFLGADISQRLFGDENPIGKAFKLDGFSFKVVGTMAKKFQNSMSNGPDDLRIVIPYTTFKSIWTYRGVWYIAVRPKNPQQNEYTKSRILEVLGSKYRFAPDDDRAISVWDSIEGARMTERIFNGIQIFLGIVGGMTLFIAGVGVANIMYVVVKERTREIGIKRAIGARRRHIVSQFILEALLFTSIGGMSGILLASTVIFLVQTFAPADGDFTMQMLTNPKFSSYIAVLTVSVLVGIGLLAGLYPARRASKIEPMEALRYE